MGMSAEMILTAVHDLMTSHDLFAQVDNYPPETPPVADKLLKMVRYFTWFVLLSGTVAIIYAGGKFAWEKWQGGPLESPKRIAGALVGGIVATSAGTIMNTVIGT